MTDQPYTEDHVDQLHEAFAKAWAQHLARHPVPGCDPELNTEDCCDQQGLRAVLDALADASRLLPADGKKQTEHEIHWRNRNSGLDNPTMTYQDFTEHQVDNEIAQANHLGYEPQAIRRRIITTWPDGATFTGAWEAR